MFKHAGFIRGHANRQRVTVCGFELHDISAVRLRPEDYDPVLVDRRRSVKGDRWVLMNRDCSAIAGGKRRVLIASEVQAIFCRRRHQSRRLPLADDALHHAQASSITRTLPQGGGCAAPKRCPSCGGRAGARHLGGARLFRPSRPRSHMLAYKDLTRRRDTETRLCVKHEPFAL